MQATFRPAALKTIAVPNEHGAWGFWLEASLLGLIVAPSPAGFWLALTALLVIFVRHPLKLALSDWTRGKRYPRTRHAVVIAAVYALATSLTALLAHSSAERAFWLPLLLAAPLALVQLERDARNKGRDLSAELCGALAFDALAGSIALAGGASLETALGLWAALALRTAPSILYVRAKLRLVRNESVNLSSVAVAHMVALVIAIILCTARVTPWTLVIGGVALTARAFWALRRSGLKKASLVGALEIVVGIGFAVLVGFGGRPS
jgi:hypothetical protein